MMESILEFRCVNQLALNSAMTKYILCNEWIGWKDARETILTVSKEQQYIYWTRSRKNPSKIYLLLVTEVRDDWEVFYNRN